MSSKDKLRLVPLQRRKVSFIVPNQLLPFVNSSLRSEFQMPKLVKLDKKAKDAQKSYKKNDLWIAPANSFKRTVLQSNWKLRRVEPSESNRFLELADIALGLSTAERPKRKSDRIDT